MSTNVVVGTRSVPAPKRLGRVMAVVLSLAVAVSIGIGMTQSHQDVALDRFHPGHPEVTGDRQERITALRDAEQVSPDSEIEEYKRLLTERLAETRAVSAKRPPRQHR
jgi:hypothetical protein